MSKIKLTLKWKFTLLTVIIMTIASALLVTAINYDINKKMPQLAGTIVAETELYLPMLQYEGGSIGLVGKIEPDNYIYQGDISMEILPIIIDSAVGTTVSNIYTTSIIVFIIVIILGAVTTYFIVDKALKPVVKLNENIKDINENNLTANLEVKGANDEIKELTISFNKMLAKHR